LLPGRNCIGMATSSGVVGSDNDPFSDMEEEVHEVFSDRDIPECEGVPRHLWTTKYVSLHNCDGIAVGEGICHSVKSDLVLGSRGPLGDTHVAVQISRSFRTIGGTLSGPGQSSMYFLTVPAFSTMRGVTSSIVEESTRVYDQDAADEELPLLRFTFPYHSYLGRPTLYCLKNQ
jgi:hypothetical protein